MDKANQPSGMAASWETSLLSPGDGDVPTPILPCSVLDIQTSFPFPVRPLAGAGISVRILWWRKTFLRHGLTWLLHSDWPEAERAVIRAKPSTSRLCNAVLQYHCFRTAACLLLYLLLLPGSQHHCLTLLVLIQRRHTPPPHTLLQCIGIPMSPACWPFETRTAL